MENKRNQLKQTENTVEFNNNNIRKEKVSKLKSKVKIGSVDPRLLFNFLVGLLFPFPLVVKRQEANFTTGHSIWEQLSP